GGAADIGHARSKLLSTISSAESSGFKVADDGSVTAPTLPPVMTQVGDPNGAAQARNQQQQHLNDQAQGIADDISVALDGVATADGSTAKALTAIHFPQTLESAVEAYLERARTSKDLVGALGTAGGAVSLALLLKKAFGIFGKSKSLFNFLKSSTAPITDYE